MVGGVGLGGVGLGGVGLGGVGLDGVGLGGVGLGGVGLGGVGLGSVGLGGVGVEVSFEFTNFTVNVTAFVSLSTIPFPKSTSTGSCAFQSSAFTSTIRYFTFVGSPKMVTDCLWWR